MSEQGRGSGNQFQFSYEQRVNWLRLYRSQNVGPITFRDLISHFGTAAAAIDAIPDMAKRGGTASRIQIASIEDTEREIARAEKLGSRYITMGEPGFPSLLRGLEHAPPILCCQGNLDLFNKKSVAIVGSRNASISGMRLTERLAGELGQKDYAIISGLARGIDTAAHKASLQTGTIAVLAGGIGKVFPKENIELAGRIAQEGGLVVSEMPVDYQAVATDFPKRNRIVAGLSQGVLVVEAATRSGSLITARLANETGKTVLAIPGSPLDPRSAGTNGLIREGATLVTCADDIIEALAPLHSSQNEFIYDISEDGGEEVVFDGQPEIERPDKLQDAPQNIRDRIIAAIGAAPVEVDDIIRFCDAEPGQVQLVLLELSLAGRLERHSGNRISMI